MGLEGLAARSPNAGATIVLCGKNSVRHTQQALGMCARYQCAPATHTFADTRKPASTNGGSYRRRMGLDDPKEPPGAVKGQRPKCTA